MNYTLTETIVGTIVFIASIGFIFFIMLFLPRVYNYMRSISIKNFTYAEIEGNYYTIKKVFFYDNFVCVEFYTFKDAGDTVKIFVHQSKVKLYENVDFIAEEWYKVQQENKKEGEKN
jgi:hypothetical protein